MILATGVRSSIVKAYSPGKGILRYDLAAANDLRNADQGIIAAGVLYQMPTAQQTVAGIVLSSRVNFIDPMVYISLHLTANPRARIAVIGTQSAIAGSFDQTYAASKAGLHAFVRFLQATLGPDQRLALIVPPIISDAGMTLARKDYPAVLQERPWCTTADVVAVVDHVLNCSVAAYAGYLHIVQPTGGKMHG